MINEWLLVVFLIFNNGDVKHQQVEVESLQKCQTQAHELMGDARKALKLLGKRPEEFIQVRSTFIWCAPKSLQKEM